MIEALTNALRRQGLRVQISPGPPIIPIKYGVSHFVPDAVCSLFSPFESGYVGLCGGKSGGINLAVFP